MGHKKRGKVVTTFPYTKNGLELHVPLRLAERHQVDGRDALNDPHQLWYLVDYDKPRVFCDGPDAEKVRLEAIRQLDAQTTIVWERKILVTIDASKSRESHHNGHHAEFIAGLGFEVAYIDVGTNSTGEVCYSELRWRTVDGLDCSSEYYLPSGAMNPEAWELRRDSYVNSHDPVTAFTDAGVQKTLLPYTAENVAKIEAVRAGIRTLSERMQELFTEKNLAHTMANITSLGLPAPEPKKAKK